MDFEKKTSQSIENIIPDTNNIISDSLDKIFNLSEVKVYNQDGKSIFNGTPEQLMIFWKNKDYGNIGNIGGITDGEGKSVFRFGALDGRGFINRGHIESIFNSMESRLNQKGINFNDKSQIGVVLEQRSLRDSNLEISKELSTEDKEKLLQDIKKIVSDTYFSRRINLYFDLDLVAKGIYPDTLKPFEKVSGEIGESFDAHGISKNDQLNRFLELLEKGIDPDRPFFTAPFEVSKEKGAALGAGLGTAGGTAYKDGIAVVTSGYKEKLSENGIKHVFINDVYANLKEPISQLFPNYQVHLLSEQKKVMEAEVFQNNENGK